MLSLTRKCDYALVALACLAQRHLAGEPPVSARRVAAEFHLPLPLLMNILKELTHARIVTSTRGPQGGYVLATGPDQISLLDVLTALEGPVRLAECTDLLPVLGQACERAGSCPMHGPVRRLHARLRDFFADVTLADLLESKVDVPTTRVGRPALA